MSFIDQAVQDIDTHLAELQSEVGRLEAARSALMGSSTPTRTARPATGNGSSSTPATRRPGRPRGRKGNRGAQALQLVQEQPGITIPQLAQAMKIEPNYLYRVMPKLVSDGKVVKDGTGYNVVGEEPAAA